MGLGVWGPHADTELWWRKSAPSSVCCVHYLVCSVWSRGHWDDRTTAVSDLYIILLTHCRLSPPQHSVGLWWGLGMIPPTNTADAKLKCTMTSYRHWSMTNPQLAVPSTGQGHVLQVLNLRQAALLSTARCPIDTAFPSAATMFCKSKLKCYVANTQLIHNGEVDDLIQTRCSHPIDLDKLFELTHQ